MCLTRLCAQDPIKTLEESEGSDEDGDEDGDEDIEGESCVAVVGAVGKLCCRFKLEGERELRWETERG